MFSSCIGYLKDDAMSTVTNRLSSRAVTSADIRWVLTVPTIWHDAAKQFMREAAEDKSMFYKISTVGLFHYFKCRVARVHIHLKTEV